MTDFIQIPLEQRLESARSGCVCQPEYLPALILQWADMPIAAYFGQCGAELERLRSVLGLAPEDNPAYMKAAAMIAGLPPCGDARAQAAELLAAPVRARAEKYRKGRGSDD